MIVTIRFHAHAKSRMKERGASEEEVVAAIEQGEVFPAKFGRTGFRRNFPFDAQWMTRSCKMKQIEAFTVQEDQDTVVITVIVKYF